tara:strand:- start:611 stop:1861 length:1251 start_codon:yes stop_codon:yes gene_type:complete
MTSRASAWLTPILLITASCQQGPQGMQSKPGPSMTLAADAWSEGGPHDDLQWIVTAPSYNSGADGNADSVDHRLTLAVQSPDAATWLVATRISGRSALELSERLRSTLTAWNELACLHEAGFPMALEITAPSDDAAHATEADAVVLWTVDPHPGGDLSRPSISMTARPLVGQGSLSATVTMDLSDAAALQRRLARFASTVPLGTSGSVDRSEWSGPGWTTLFDGTSMEHFRGFKQRDMPDGWEIVDGALTLTGSGGDIVTRKQYDDFELELQWRVTEAGNSGIFYNVTEDCDHVWETGPEMQVLDDERHYDGKNELTSAGANYALHAPVGDVVRPAGEWNTARILVCGNEVTYWLNGVEVVSYVLHSADWKALVAGSKFASMPDYGQRSSGHIALQDHGDVVSFRDIRIRDLGSRD